MASRAATLTPALSLEGRGSETPNHFDVDDAREVGAPRAEGGGGGRGRSPRSRVFCARAKPRAVDAVARSEAPQTAHRSSVLRGERPLAPAPAR